MTGTRSGGTALRPNHLSCLPAVSEKGSVPPCFIHQPHFRHLDIQRMKTLGSLHRAASNAQVIPQKLEADSRPSRPSNSPHHRPRSRPPLGRTKPQTPPSPSPLENLLLILRLGCAGTSFHSPLVIDFIPSSPGRADRLLGVRSRAVNRLTPRYRKDHRHRLIPGGGDLLLPFKDHVYSTHQTVISSPETAKLTLSLSFSLKQTSGRTRKAFV
ncbi:hypothetical protein LZ30DRAFT_709248 [Colletotrichum cereale]|nr:hypothetical protein LZ30DRAFT_709248 [Colletotrichum cereale]